MIQWGEPEVHVALIVAGLVKVVGYLRSPEPVTTPESLAKLGVRDTAVFVIGEGFWMGLETFYAAPNVLRHVALTEGKMILMTRDEAFDIMTGPLLFGAFRQSVDLMQRLARDLSYRRAHLGLRVISQLARLHRWTQVPEIPITLKEIAQLTGSHYSRISAVMRALEELGLVDCGRKHYHLTDKFSDVAEIWLAISQLADLDASDPRSPRK